MNHLTDEALKDRLTLHLAEGKYNLLRSEFGTLGNSNPDIFGLLQSLARRLPTGGAESPQGLEQGTSPAEKFNKRWNELMSLLPNGALKDSLSRHLANKEYNLVRDDLKKLGMSSPDQRTFELSQSLARGITTLARTRPSTSD